MSDKSDKFPTEQIVIRNGNPNDLEKVLKILLETSKVSFKEILSADYLNGLSKKREPRDFWKNYFESRYQIFVAEEEKGEIIGFIDYYELPKEIPFEVQINEFYVLPEYQRKGIGSKLFNRVIDEIIAQGKTSVGLYALEKSPYNKFYQNRGGVIVNYDFLQSNVEEPRTVFYQFNDLSKI